MRISELSKQGGASIATIKFYLREGLLPPGEPTAKNQAEYNETHVARVRLIRTLTGIGQLSLSSVRTVLTAVDGPHLALRELCIVLNQALFAEQVATNEVVGEDRARQHIDKFLDELGWQVQPDSPGRQTLARVLAALRYLGWDCEADIFLPHAAAAQHLVRQERAALSDDPSTTIARSLLFGVAFTAMRRLAQEDIAPAT
jgi:DNA-binding transcriptional MerR regulator